VSPTDVPRDPSRDELRGIAWHISSRSDNGGASCVEAGPLADGTGRIAVRHSHQPHGQLIVYTRQEWNAFIEGVKIGEFDFDS
jgi:hypothetical protein